MSGMADEMRARMEADAAAGLAPGNEGGSPPNQPSPAAGPSNTDTDDGSGTPDTIPYARFKEVNDRYNGLKDFEELREYGYDADSLRRLAAFEAGYLQDPVGTVAAMTDNLDLPQEVKNAVREQLTAGLSNESAEGEPSGDGKAPVTELPPEIQERLNYVDQLREREAETTREAQLQAVVEAWNELDRKDGIETPERVKLTHIAAAAGSGHKFTTFEELAVAARDVALEYRSSVLGSAVRTDRGGSPPALPSGGHPASGPVKFDSLRAASKAAEADIAAGRLPAIQP